MKQFLHLPMLLAFCLFHLGCGRPTPSSDSIVLGVIPKSSGGEFWEDVNVGAQQAADDLGISIRWEGTVTETAIAEQNQIIENMITMGVQGIALAPLNARAMRRQVETAVNAGIPVIVFDSSIEGDSHSAYVATDNKQGGRLAAEHLASLLEEGKTRVMAMRFIQGAGSTEERVAGFAEAAEKMGLTVLADPYSDTGTIEGCKTAAANTMEGFIQDGRLELDGIFACNLYATLGVSSALMDLQNSGIDISGLRFVGFDTSTALTRALEEGRIDALIAQNPERMGYLAVETLLKVVRGEAVDPVIDTGVSVITRASLSAE